MAWLGFIFCGGIKIIRQQKNSSQSELAKAADINVKSLSRKKARTFAQAIKFIFIPFQRCGGYYPAYEQTFPLLSEASRFVVFVWPLAYLLNSFPSSSYYRYI